MGMLLRRAVVCKQPREAQHDMAAQRHACWGPCVHAAQPAHRLIMHLTRPK